MNEDIKCSLPYDNQTTLKTMFRGRRLYVDGGASLWVEGDLITNPNIKIREITNSPSIEVAVDPSTVGQYTGVDDQDDRRIFEGDIVEFETMFPVINGTTKHVDRIVRHYSCWSIQVSLKGDFNAYTYFDLNTASHKWQPRKLRIIGNIYDGVKRKFS